MIDLKILREDPELIRAGMVKKRRDVKLLDEAIDLDQEYRSLLTQVEELRAGKNKKSEEIAQMEGGNRQKAIEAMQKVSEDEKSLKAKLEKAEQKLQEVLSRIPNPPHESVPDGEDDEDNEVVSTHGVLPDFEFEPRDHIELGKMTDTIDIEAAADHSGARFYYLKNEAVRLEFAIVQHILNKLVEKGFIPVIPPVLVKEQAMYATGFFPADRNEIYHVNPEDDDLFLIGTSEVPLTMLHANKIMDPKEFPKRYVGFSTCFRREAGSYGKDTHGIIRVHQFDKLEMFSFCHPSQSEAEHELIREIEEEIMQDLGFHYQVVNVCGGDLGDPAAKKYDIEAWIPTQGKFRELTSCSNCTDFQARRSKIRFKNENGKTQFAHTLNGTAIAIARTLVTLLENNQNEDGSINIPTVLQPYLGGQTVIEPK